MKPSMMITIAATMIATLVMMACGGAQDQPAAPEPAPAQPTEVTPQPEPEEEEAIPPAEPQEPQGATSMGQQEMAAMCPMAVEGTVVRAEDTAAGVALVFTTPGQMDELRGRVARMAEMHAQQGREAPQQRAQVMHQAEVRAEDTEAGARLVFTPTDPAQLEALREGIQQHATEMMLSGQCPAHGFLSVEQPGTEQPTGEPTGRYGGQRYGGPRTTR